MPVLVPSKIVDAHKEAVSREKNKETIRQDNYYNGTVEHSLENFLRHCRTSAAISIRRSFGQATEA